MRLKRQKIRTTLFADIAGNFGCEQICEQTQKRFISIKCVFLSKVAKMPDFLFATFPEFPSKNRSNPLAAVGNVPKNHPDKFKTIRIG